MHTHTTNFILYSGDALHFHPNLKVLNISHCQIPAKACVVIATGIQEAPQLQSIILTGNHIGEIGAKSLTLLHGHLRDNINIDIRDCVVKGNDHSLDNQYSVDKLDPDIEYILDLSKPYQRSFLVQILQLLANAKDMKLKHF